MSSIEGGTREGVDEGTITMRSMNTFDLIQDCTSKSYLKLITVTAYIKSK